MRARRRSVAKGVGALALVLGASLLAACEADKGAVPPRDEPTRTAVDRTLTFADFGPAPEVEAYRSLVSVYNSLYDDAEMEVVSYSSRQEFMGTMRESGEVPDVFLASGRDLKWLEDRQVLQPVDQLLLERGVDFGDLYSRDSVLAFSAESRRVSSDENSREMWLRMMPITKIATRRSRSTPISTWNGMASKSSSPKMKIPFSRTR